MTRTEVYSWRLPPRLKADLEAAARSQATSLSRLLEGIALDWLDHNRRDDGDEEAQQARLRAEAMRWVGAIRGGRPERAENARGEVRRRLARQHGS